MALVHTPSRRARERLSPASWATEHTLVREGHCSRRKGSRGLPEGFEPLKVHGSLPFFSEERGARENPETIAERPPRDRRDHTRDALFPETRDGSSRHMPHPHATLHHTTPRARSESHAGHPAIASRGRMLTARHPPHGRTSAHACTHARTTAHKSRPGASAMLSPRRPGYHGSVTSCKVAMPGAALPLPRYTRRTPPHTPRGASDELGRTLDEGACWQGVGGGVAMGKCPLQRCRRTRPSDLRGSPCTPGPLITMACHSWLVRCNRELRRRDESEREERRVPSRVPYLIPM